MASLPDCPASFVGLSVTLCVLVSLFTIEAVRSQLLVLLTEAVDSLDRDEISNESFQSLRGIWQISVDLLRERAGTLQDDEGELAGQFQPKCAQETPA